MGMRNWDDWNPLVKEENRFESPNRSDRSKGIEKPTHIVIHITGSDKFNGAKNRFLNKKEKASAHYCILQDSTITQFVRDKHCAWHAGITKPCRAIYDKNDNSFKKYLMYFSWSKAYGKNAVYLKSDLSKVDAGTPKSEYVFAMKDDGSEWGYYSFWEKRHNDLTSPVMYDVNKSPNDYSIGIELCTHGSTDPAKYAEGLYEGLEILLDDLCTAYDIPRNENHIIGHEDVNPMARWGWDPNEGFDWKRILKSRPISFSLPLDITGLETKLTPTPDAIAKYYEHSETLFAGGNYPVGSNTTWHGGLHLLGEDGQSVHAVADGYIVAARMPVNDTMKDRLKYGSRNFVLLRHGEGRYRWYSLYYHLKSVPMDGEEAKKISWLQAQYLKFKSNVNFREDADASSKLLGTFQGSNDSAKETEKAFIVGKEFSPWYAVQRPSDGQFGYVKYDPKLADIIDGTDYDTAKRFNESDDVCQVILRNVKAGDLVGYVGDGLVSDNGNPVLKPIVHFAIFSPDCRDNGWSKVVDDNKDFTCDIRKIIDLIENEHDGSDPLFQKDGKITAAEIEKFYSDPEKSPLVRDYACKFITEFAIDWKSVTEPFKKQGFSVDAETIALYNYWWNEVLQSTIDELPKDGIIWHYNPIRFIEKEIFGSVRITFLEDCFEPNKSFPLPEKIQPLFKKLGGHLKKESVNTSLVIGHAGVKGDSTDAVALSEKRAAAIKWIMTLDDALIDTQLKEEGWKKRECRLLLGFLRDKDGKKYYTSPLDKDNNAELEKSVKKFQTDNGLSSDGDPGKKTFTKAFEILMKNCGIEAVLSGESIGVGDAHPPVTDEDENANGEKVKDAPKRVVELLLWPSEIEPAVAKYADATEKTYTRWIQSVKKDLSASSSSSGGGDTVLLLQLPADADRDTDTLKLLDSKGSVLQEIKTADCPTEDCGDEGMFIRLEMFDELDQHTDYSLIRMFGNAEHGGYEPLFVNLSPLEIEALCNGQPQRSESHDDAVTENENGENNGNEGA
jgi:N-acetyl-anhydromuramyl-L-alanine amidase AmpD